MKYYREIKEEIDRLTLSKDIAREAILSKFRDLGIRRYYTNSGLIATTTVREGRKYISVKEAESLLDADTFNKLLKQGETMAVLSVRQVKEQKRDV